MKCVVSRCFRFLPITRKPRTIGSECNQRQVWLPAASEVNVLQAGADVKRKVVYLQMLIKVIWKMGDSHLKAHLQLSVEAEVFIRRVRGTEHRDQGWGLKSSPHADQHSLLQRGKWRSGTHHPDWGSWFHIVLSRRSANLLGLDVWRSESVSSKASSKDSYTNTLFIYKVRISQSQLMQKQCQKNDGVGCNSLLLHEYLHITGQSPRDSQDPLPLANSLQAHPLPSTPSHVTYLSKILGFTEEGN